MKFAKRPILTNIVAIKNAHTISLRLAMGINKDPYVDHGDLGIITKPSSPWQNIEFFEKNDFRVKIVGLTKESERILIKEYNTDEYGKISVKLPAKVGMLQINSIQIYEIKFREGLELLLGSFIPLTLQAPTKILISDFDKTLVDTKYSTPKELLQSLRNPLNYFPTIEKSLELVKDYIKQGYAPFILSASPHFYEKPFRDWLYQNEIYTSNIFLKDYRKIFSFFEGELTPKDLRVQGFFKLNELVNIILMTGIPNRLLLIGDGFESDPIIYLIIRSVLAEKLDPWMVWKRVRRLGSFRLTRSQQAKFLTNLHLLNSLERPRDFELKIHIRCRPNNIEAIKARKTYIDFIDRQLQFISYYSA